MKKNQVLGYIVVTFRISKENDHFVSVCPELDVASCGDTIEEALKNIQEATLLYLNTIEEQKERQRVFHEKKIRLHHAKPPKTKKIEVKLNEFVSTFVTQVPVTNDPITAVI